MQRTNRESITMCKYAEFNGTNVVDASPLDGATVWLDLRPGVPADERYKMAIVCAVSCSHYTLKYSADGIKWREVLKETGPTQDRASIFFNPFTSKWVYSIKQGIESADPVYQLGRSRKFWHGDDLIEAVRGVTFSFSWNVSRFHRTHREIRD
eukprot:SAG31_NODE_674_length_12909_cov_25.961124_6_plen_153_part_00